MSKPDRNVSRRSLREAEKHLSAMADISLEQNEEPRPWLIAALDAVREKRWDEGDEQPAVRTIRGP